MLKPVATATAFQIISLGISLLDRFVLGALLLRFWGVTVFEDWSLLLAAASMMSLFDFGLQQTFGNALTQTYQEHRSSGFMRLMAVAAGINLAILIIGSMILLVLAYDGSGPGFVATKQLTGSTGQSILVIIGVTILLQTVSGWMTQIYRSQGRFSRSIAIDATLLALRTAIIALVVLAGGSALAAAVAYFMVTALFVLLVIPLDLKTNLATIYFSLAWPTYLEWRWLGNVAPWFYVQHGATILLLGATLLFLGAIADAPGVVAMFLFLRMLVNFARTILQYISISVGIEVSRLHAAGAAQNTISNHLHRSTRLMCVLCGTIVGTLLPLAFPLAQIWSGGRIVVEPAVAAILATGLLVSGPFMLIASFLAFVGRARIGAISKLVNGGLALALCLVLNPRYGATGVAMALATGEIAGLALVLLPDAAKLLQMSRARLALAWSGLSLLGFLPPALAGFALTSLQQRSALETLSLALVFIAPLGAVTLIAIGLSGTDRATLWKQARPLVAWKEKR